MLLSDVCLSRTSGVTREQRGLGRLNWLRGSPRDSDTTFNVKSQGHQAALVSVALTRKVAAAVSVGTYSAWESTATLRLLGLREALGRPRGRRGAGAYCIAMRTACCG